MTQRFPIMKHPTERQVQYWMNRIQCGEWRSKEERWAASTRKFHDMCVEDMLEEIQTITVETDEESFKHNVPKLVIDELKHLVNRLVNAHTLLSEQDDIAANENGVSLHRELENEFKGFFARFTLGQSLPPTEMRVLESIQAHVLNYFFHSHHLCLPIVPGEKEKYWEEYNFGSDEDIDDHWRVGEGKRKRRNLDESNSSGVPKKKSPKKTP